MKIFTTFYTGIMFGMLIAAGIVSLMTEPISFYKLTATYKYADQEATTFPMEGWCKGKDCAINQPRKEIDGVFVSKYSANYDIETYWITK